jgi:hypothetical protein
VDPDTLDLSLDVRPLVLARRSGRFEEPLHLAGPVIVRPVEDDGDFGVLPEVPEHGLGRLGRHVDRQATAVVVHAGPPHPGAVRLQFAVAGGQGRRQAGLEEFGQFGRQEGGRVHGSEA